MATEEYKFLSEPDDALKCLICLEVAVESWQHGDCGRLFCNKCLDKYGRDDPCPNCRMKQPQYFPDNKSRREIRSLRVKCHNFECTCPWEGTVGTLEEHMATCQFTLLLCPNQCKDDSNKTNHFMRKDLIYHLEYDCPNREYKCQYCGEEGTYTTITQLHDKMCEMMIVPCANHGCHKTLQRRHIPQHIKSQCEYTVIACKYKSIGCETVLKRRDMVAHELDDALHLHMAISAITRLKNENGSIVPKEGESMNIKFINYQERKESMKVFTFPPFYTSLGYHVTLEVHANGYGDGEGTHVSVFVTVVEGKHDSYLEWPLLGSVNVKLLNHLEDDNHHSEVISLNSEHNMRVGSCLGYADFIPHYALDHDPIKNTHYLKNDTLYFRVEVKVKADKPWHQYGTV